MPLFQKLSQNMIPGGRLDKIGAFKGFNLFQAAIRKTIVEK